MYKDRKTPVISSFTAIFINIVLDSLLYKQYRHVGLTFATSFSAMVNFIILYISLNKKYVKLRNLKYIAILGVTFVTSIISYWGSSVIKFQNKYGIVVNLTIFAIIYLIIWFALIFTFRKDLIRKVLKRRRKW